MSESAGPFDCPADGCAFRGGADAVAGHYSGKKDDEHVGHYGTVKAHLLDGGPLPSATDDGADDDTPARVDGGASGNPTFGAADPTRDPDPDVDDDPDGLELPCGHETVDRSDLPELPCNVTCDECGQTWGLRA